MMINPILRNEMKTDSRQFRFYMLLMLYIGLLGIPVLISYRAICNQYRIEASQFITLYVLLACIQAIILMFIVPALAAGSISGEREKQTLDILLTTKMSCRSIIYGKILTVTSKVVLLIFCTMPVYAIMLFLGGIKLIHIITCNLYLVMTTIFVASMCTWISTMVKTTKFANVAAYFVELGLIIGYPIAVLVGFALKSAVTPYNTNANMKFIENLIKYLLPISPAAGYGFLLSDQLHISDGIFDIIGSSHTKMLVPGWGISIIVEVVLTIIFVELAISSLNPLKKRKYSKKKRKANRQVENA